MNVVCEIPIRGGSSKRKRICDLVLHANGKIYIVDIEEGKYGKEKYSVCINKELEQILNERERRIK